MVRHTPADETTVHGVDLLELLGYRLAAARGSASDALYLAFLEKYGTGWNWTGRSTTS